MVLFCQWQKTPPSLLPQASNQSHTNRLAFFVKDPSVTAFWWSQVFKEKRKKYREREREKQKKKKSTCGKLNFISIRIVKEPKRPQSHKDGHPFFFFFAPPSEVFSFYHKLRDLEVKVDPLKDFVL
jgi:hypothetical protein